MSLYTERTVKIDYLAATIPLSSMKFLETFDEKGHEWRKYGVLPVYGSILGKNSFKERISNGYYCPDLTEFPSIYSPSKEEVEHRISVYETALNAAYMHRLKLWINSAFGLVIGQERDRGGYGYFYSAPLYSDDGGYALLGMIYWGGNNNTFYFQIDGHGCEHVFQGTTPKKIYKWLHHLQVTQLRRLDLCTDDFDGVFTVESAQLAHKDDAFYGGMGPRPSYEPRVKFDGNGNPILEQFNVGSRTSRVYWRIYNKALEQKVDDIWYRSEVELKHVPIEVLLDIAGTYTSLCDYSASINPSPRRPINIFKPHLGDVVVAINHFESDVRWIRKQGSKTIARIFSQLGCDYEALFSAIVRPEHLSDESIRFDTPLVYQNLVAEKLKNRPCPF